jgi:hypothetical protein
VVRVQVGQTVTAEGAEAILLKGGGEVGRTPITPGQVDRNYELNIRLDQNRSNTAFYTDKANAGSGSAAGNVLLGCWEFIIPTFAKNKLKKLKGTPYEKMLDVFTHDRAVRNGTGGDGELFDHRGGRR